MIFLCAYLGFNYYGFQIQPNRQTIQYFLKEAFRKVGLPWNFKYMSRTDRGVSAVTQLLWVGKDMTVEEDLLRRINDFLPDDIIIYGYAVDRGRYWRVQWKEYLYVSRDFDDINEDLLYAIISYMNDRMLNYYFLVKRPTVTLGGESLWERYLLSYERYGEYIFIRIRGKRFYWEQVRRMVTLIMSVAREIISLKRAWEILRGSKPKAGIPPAPPEGLILWDISLLVAPDFNYLSDPEAIRNWILNEVIKVIKNVRWVFPAKE